MEHQRMMEQSQGNDDGGGDIYGMVTNTTPDPMTRHLEASIAQLSAEVRRSAEAVARGEVSPAPTQDPQRQAYEAGFWEHFQDKHNAKPGEYCVALFKSTDGIISVSGPGRDYDGALLTFWGLDIPKPADVRKIKVALDQTNSPTQTVTAFNYTAPTGGAGALALSVPVLTGLTNNMLNDHNFKLTVEGKKVFDATWHDGVNARNKLVQCVNKYKG